MIRILTLATALLFAPAAYAATIPAEVEAVIAEARAMCEPAFGTFTFEERFLFTADLNKDGAADYVLSSAGYSCSGAASLYSGSAGDNYQVFLSSGDAILKEDRSASFAAYSFNIDTKTNPPQLVYTTRCPNGPGTATTEVRRGWTGTALAEISAPCPAN